MGASGSGKSTIQHSLPIDFMTNCTTRPLREGEIDGYHIRQVGEETFKMLDANGKFFETTYYSGNYYGTLSRDIKEMLKGKPYHCTKDVVGVKLFKEKLGDKAVVVYIKPPSIEVLENRMRDRGDSEEEIRKRIKYMQQSDELENEVYADYVIVNDDLKTAQIEAHQIVIKELLNEINKNNK